MSMVKQSSLMMAGPDDPNASHHQTLMSCVIEGMLTTIKGRFRTGKKKEAQLPTLSMTTLDGRVVARMNTVLPVVFEVRVLLSGRTLPPYSPSFLYFCRRG